jgi:hypothetical protein
MKIKIENIKKMENSNLEEHKYIRAKKRVKAIKGFYIHLTVYLIVNAFIIISGAMSSGEWKIFWDWNLFSTAFFWGIGIAFHAFNVFGMNFLLGKDWEERKIKEIMDKDKKEFWE